jgi:hypothetical protein
MRSLGRLGRFGNQLFQYMFLRTYAQRHNLDYQVPAWIGQDLFGHADPPIERKLPVFLERVHHDIDDTFIPHLQSPLANVDVEGFFQYHTSYYAPQREFIESLFQPVPRVQKICCEMVERLRDFGDEIVAMHLRRGDYGFSHFFIAPGEWYGQWIEEHRAHWRRPVLYVATDDEMQARRELAGYNIVTQRDLVSAPLPFPDYFLDFYILTCASAVAISNSSFSFAACLLNRNAKVFMRPVLQFQRLVPFEPWNSKPLLQDATVEDFPLIAGRRVREK